MERYEALNLIATPIDKAIGGLFKAAQAVGAYEPMRDWMTMQLKNNMLSNFVNNHSLEIVGTENVPKDTGALIASNHQSWLDAQALGSSFEGDLHFIAKSDFETYPLLSKMIELSQSVFIRRGGDEEAIQDIVARLKEGWYVAIFPEGTIPGEEEIGRDQLQHKTGLLKGKTGVVRMALAAGVPIVPVGLSGPGIAFPPEMYPRFEMPPMEKPVPITIHYGKPLYFTEHFGVKPERETLRKLTDKVMSEISKLIDHKRCFIPIDVPMKPFNTEGITHFPKTKAKAKVGALVLHGFTSHLDCVAGVEPYLKDLGIPYRFPILRGHGTMPVNMVGTTAEDWYEDAEKALLELLQHCDKAIVCGLSMGGLMALKLGMAYPDKVSNVVLIAAALRFADPMSAFTPMLSKVFKYWDSPNAYNDPALAEERNKNYPVFATASFGSLFNEAKAVEKELKKFDRPVLIIESKKDQVVDPKAAQVIYDKISTKKSDKKIVWFKKSGHEMCLDLEAEAVLDTIGSYIKDVVEG